MKVGRASSYDRLILGLPSWFGKKKHGHWLAGRLSGTRARTELLPKLRNVGGINQIHKPRYGGPVAGVHVTMASTGLVQLPYRVYDHGYKLLNLLIIVLSNYQFWGLYHL